MSRKSFIMGIVGILFFVTLQAMPIWAQTSSDQGDTDQEQSALSNPAQAAHAQNLADAVVANDPNKSPDAALGDISGMREAGMGWGQIAHELGVHPGTLGLGHNKAKNEQVPTETEMATARNPETGGAIGHGANSGGASEDKGFEHGNQKGEDDGHGQGHGGDHGNGNGGGGGGGHGHE